MLTPKLAAAPLRYPPGEPCGDEKQLLRTVFGPSGPGGMLADGLTHWPGEAGSAQGLGGGSAA